MILYGFDNEPAEFKLKDKDIEYILVTILSGDEIATVFYADGDLDRFDSGIGRFDDFNDGSYIIRSADIERWEQFENNTQRCMSYARQKEFGRW